MDNWQTALRKQYFKRDPRENPLGPEPPRSPAAESSPAPEASEKIKIEDNHADEGDTPMVSTTHPTPAPEETTEEQKEQHNAERASMETAASPPAKDETGTPASLADAENSPPPQEESKNWLELPMLAKLDSLLLLTEWQCQNPQRLRTIMKSDDENALWVSDLLRVSCFSVCFLRTVLSFLIENRAYRI